MAKTRTDTESVLRLVINGQQAKTSTKELQDSFRKLNTELRNMREADNPQVYKEKQTQVTALKKAWDESRKAISGNTQEVKGLKASMQDIAKGVFAGNLYTRGFDMAVNGLKNFVQHNAALSDVMAGVVKTTGLSEDAVDRLNEKFKKIDTRTANTELLGLAEVAGRLGFTMESEVEGFVRAADKIGVALGEELGGVEDAVRSIGKLVDIFGVGDNFELEDALLKVGSAINELGMAGTANERTMIDFAQRMAGIAPAADISLPAVLGLGAALDELGQPLEASTTAIGQFIVKMGADIPKFAKIAKMSVTDFAKLLREDANEAFLRVMENAQSTSGGIAELSKNMDMLGVAGARGVAALGVLANNTDKVRERQRLANSAFGDGVSILEEFDNVNNTLGANLEKIGNQLRVLWEHSGLRTWLTDLTAGLADNRAESQRLSDEYFKLNREVDSLDAGLGKMIERHDELKSKTVLSREQQEELEKIIREITIAVPHAATEFDEYGRVIAVNTERAREFIEAQRAMLSYKNKDAIQAAEKDLANYTDEFDRLNLALEEGYTRSSSVFGNMKTYRLTDLMRGQYSERLKELGNLKKGAEDLIKTLSGEPLVTSTGEKTPDEDEEPTIIRPTTKIDDKAAKKAEQQREQAKKEYEKMLADFGALDAQRALDLLGAAEREIAVSEAKYDKLKQQLEEFKKLEGATAEQKAEADKKILALEEQRELASREIRARQEAAYLVKIHDLRESLEARRATELDRERVRINKFYEGLIREHAGQAEVIAELERARDQDLTDAKIREAERLKTEKERLERAYSRTGMSEREQRLADINVKYDAEIESLKERFNEELQLTQEFRDAVEAIEQGRRQAQVELDREMWKQRRDYAVQSAEIVADAVFQITASNMRAESDAKLSEIRKQREQELNNKRLTEAQKKGINDRYDAMERREKLRAWQAQKRADLSQAIIATALGVARSIPNWVQMGMAALAGGTQIAVIAGQKPPQFGKGGILPGPSHAQGGIDLWDSRRQKVIGKIEGNEPILSRNTYRNNKPIVDELLYSSMRRNGAAIQLNPSLIDADRIVRNGGAAMASQHSAAARQPAVQTPVAVDTSGMERIVRDLAAIVAKSESKPVVLSSRALEDHNERVARIRNEVNA